MATSGRPGAGVVRADPAHYLVVGRLDPVGEEWRVGEHIPFADEVRMDRRQGMRPSARSAEHRRQQVRWTVRCAAPAPRCARIGKTILARPACLCRCSSRPSSASMRPGCGSLHGTVGEGLTHRPWCTRCLTGPDRLRMSKYWQGPERRTRARLKDATVGTLRWGASGGQTANGWSVRHVLPMSRLMTMARPEGFEPPTY